ncbi:hypothetical protein G6O69_06915 [Pseudenhygromyxa sp. WMMC2535]|uniref:hypothetical protein n=1 Tax=Pseudenhygromyxa sp. WMMC2535 TaxID=2712867 RepID=UPI001556A483|nr:hypothetical protein [Pseudenhygromyxa sp. WMMC2535]NVB37557.1 hypothetical protein [Pseudenhygromyxa sp. WMMC2535]
MKALRTMILALPLLTLACDSGDESEDLRGIAVEEPCEPDDCVPLSPLIEESECPEGYEFVSWGECVDADGECVWAFYDDCVPVSEPDEDPDPQSGEPDPTPGGVNATARSRTAG